MSSLSSSSTRSASAADRALPRLFGRRAAAPRAGAGALGAAGFAALGAAGWLLAGIATADSLITGPQACAAVNIAQSERLEWREDGLFNRDPDRALFVVCPFLRSPLEARFTGEVRVRNDSGVRAEVECAFREIDLAGEQQRVTRRSLSLAPGEAGSLLVDDVALVEAESFYSVTCRLPPDTAIVTLINNATFATTAGDGGGGGGGGDDGGDAGGPAPGTSAFNRQQTERLRGSWTFVFTILSTFTDRYVLSRVEEEATAPGTWNIYGSDEFGGAVVAAYLPDSELWVLLDPGTIIDQFFAFDFVSVDEVTGCYFQIDPPGSSELSDCFPMNGRRTAGKLSDGGSAIGGDALARQLQAQRELHAWIDAARKAGVPERTPRVDGATAAALHQRLARVQPAR